jgi:hypothetical protein
LTRVSNQAFQVMKRMRLDGRVKPGHDAHKGKP